LSNKLTAREIAHRRPDGMPALSQKWLRAYPPLCRKDRSETPFDPLHRVMKPPQSVIRRAD
jgi:hypothetical protein